MTMFRVTGADGRRVGVYSLDELYAFKASIQHNVQTEVMPAGGNWRPVDMRPRPETFEIVELDDTGGHTCEPTYWTPTPPEAASERSEQ